MSDLIEQAAKIIAPSAFAESKSRVDGAPTGGLKHADREANRERARQKAREVLALAAEAPMGERGTVRSNPAEALRLIAEGWAVIESDGRHITIEPPEYEDEEVGEMIVDTHALPADVERLVKAAREEKLAGIIMAADDDGVEAIHELFAAANDFASRVPLNEGEGR